MEKTDKSKRPHSSLWKQLLQECDAMTKYALASGLDVPDSIVPTVEKQLNVTDHTDADIKNVTRVHTNLAAIIAPATPRAILLLSTESKNRLWQFIEPVQLVRRMMIAAVISLIAIIGISTSEIVNEEVLEKDWLGVSGKEGAVILLFLLFSAAIGASFQSLFTANRFVVSGTFDPKYESSYWIRFLLGLIAGIMLAEMIPINQQQSQLLAKPTLALLGGFSANVVYRILHRLTAAVESLVKGDTEDMLAAQMRQQKARADQEIGQSRLKLAASLLQLEREIGPDIDHKRLKKRVEKLMDELMPVKLEQQDKEAN